MDKVDKYNTDDELKIRKILEGWFPFEYELHRNPIPYDYDIELFKVVNNCEKLLIGYIELETTPTWENYYLDNGYVFSFLARKVFKYNKEIEKFTYDIKDENKSPKTVYFKLNKDFTNGYCCDIPTIMEFKRILIKKYKNGDLGLCTYNDTMLRTNINNKKVGYGLTVCKDFMLNFFIGNNEAYREM